MKQRMVGQVAILYPRGYLTGGDETEELEQTIKNLAEAGNKRLIINLGEVKHMKSVALGVLISAHSNYVRRGGSMRLCFLDKKIENIFVITRLSLVFDVYPTEELAITSFADFQPTV